MRQTLHLRGQRGELRAVALVLLVALATVGATTHADAARSKAQPFTLRIGMTASGDVLDGNMGWGSQQGTLLKALRPVGVTKITFALFQAGPAVQTALASHAVDVAVTGDMPALQARGNGVRTRQIGFTSIDGESWVIGQKGGPKTLEGLAGKKVTAPTDTVRYRFLYGLLVDKHLTGKVQISNLGTPESIAALKSGSIDALSVGGVQAIQLIDEGYPVLAAGSAYPSLRSTEESTALQSFLDDHPGFRAAWGKAIGDTNANLRQHGQAYWNYNAKIDQATAAQEKQSTPLDNYNETPFPAAGVTQLQSTYQFLSSQKQIAHGYQVTSWLDRG